MAKEEKQSKLTGTEVTKWDFFHPLSIRYFRTGLVIRQGDMVIRIVRADLPEFSIELDHAIRGVMRLKEYVEDEDEEEGWIKVEPEEEDEMVEEGD